MRFYVCHNVTILAELSKDEAILQVYDLQIEALDVHGYHVFREDGEIEIATIGADGAIVWQPAQQAPASHAERLAVAFFATHGPAIGQTATHA